MSYQDRSYFWRLRHSWWMLLALPYVTAFLAFAYIGIRARRMRWIAASVFYLGVMLYLFSQRTDLAVFTTLGMWIVSFVHAESARRRFLAVMDAREGGAPREVIHRS